MQCDKCDSSGFYTLGDWPRKYTCARCLGTGQAVMGQAYAGIGSRETPMSVIREMENVAMQMALRGWTLRSGEAKRPVNPKPDTDSADLAFERGCKLVAGRKIIRTTADGPAMDHAAQFHPNWEACNDHARRLHARNSLIMLGDWLDDPVRVVVCYTAGGAIKGGTGQALRVAAALAIPVVNLAVDPVDKLWSIIQ